MDMPKLLDQMREVIRTLHYSIRTEDAYVDWARRFILFHGKQHPASMGTPQVEAFLSHLAVERRVSASTQNQAKAALPLSPLSARTPAPIRFALQAYTTNTGSQTADRKRNCRDDPSAKTHRQHRPCRNLSLRFALCAPILALRLG